MSSLSYPVRSTLAVAAVVLLCGAARGSAQEPQTPIFKAKVELVRVDVSVTGRDDKAIEDLKAEEFEVEEDGLPQTVETAQFIRLDGQVPAGFKEAIDIRSLDHGRREAAREDVRVFVIFLDDYHVDKAPQITLPLRRALEEFVKQLGPYDIGAVMEPLTPLSHVKFTRNREELLAQMHAFEGRRGEVFPVKSAAEEAQLSARNLSEVRASVTLDALNAIVTHLGGLKEGRKSVLFVSQGPPTGMSTANPNFARLQEVLRNANRGNVTDQRRSIRGRSASARSAADFVLRMLADTTGGRAIVNTNDPSRALRQVIDDASAYYLVGYTPTRAELNDGKFHKISVQCEAARPRRQRAPGLLGAVARGDDAETARAAADRRRQRAQQISFGPVEGRDFDVWVGATRGTERRDQASRSPGIRPADSATRTRRRWTSRSSATTESPRAPRRPSRQRAHRVSRWSRRSTRRPGSTHCGSR